MTALTAGSSSPIINQLAASGHHVAYTVRTDTASAGIGLVTLGDESFMGSQDYTKRFQKAISTIFLLVVVSLVPRSSGGLSTWLAASPITGFHPEFWTHA